MQNFYKIFFGLILLSSSLYSESNLQDIIDKIPPYHWNEELLKRDVSAIYGSTKHGLILKSKQLENDTIREYNIQLKLFNILQEFDPHHILQQNAIFLEPRNLIVHKEISRYFFIMKRNINF